MWSRVRARCFVGGALKELDFVGPGEAVLRVRARIGRAALCEAWACRLARVLESQECFDVVARHPLGVVSCVLVRANELVARR